MRKRVVGRLGAALILVGAAGLGFAGQATAEGDGSGDTYTVTARADTFAFEFVETGAPAAPGGEIFYATPSTAQALLDSVGRSQGFAAAPSPGPFFATLPSNGNGVLAGFGFPFSFPDYPFYAASDYPVSPTSDRAFGPFRARAESNQYGAVGDARSGGLTNDDPAFMSSRAAARVTLDPDTRVRTAVADSRFDAFTSGPLAIGQSLAHAKMTQTPGSPPTRESSFTIGSITIAGVQIAMTDKGFKLGDQAPPTADMAQLFGVLAQAGITVEYLPAKQTDTSTDSAGLRITRAGADPNGTQHKVALILGRVGTSIQGGTSPLISGDTTVVPDNPSPAALAPAPVTTAPETESDVEGAASSNSRGAELSTGASGSSVAEASSPLPSTLSSPGPVAAPAVNARGTTRLVTPAVASPWRGPSATGFYVTLLVAGLIMTAGTRLIAALGVRLGLGAGAAMAAEAPASVLRLPGRASRGESMKTAAPPAATAAIPTGVVPQRRSATIWLWAAAGGVSTFVVLRGLAAWMAGPDFKSSPKGSDPISDTKLFALHCFEGAVFTVGLLMLWRYLVRPLVQERRFTFDGMLLVAVLLMYFYDPLDNYFNYTFSYNAHFLNFASWAREVPGLQAPNQRFFPEPFLVMGGFYAIFMFGSAVFGCWYMRKLAAKHPDATNLRLFAHVFLIVLIIDTVVENVFMRTQFAAYPGVVHSLSLFAGKYYQFPLYEPFIIATFACGMTAIRWFRDDRGQSLAERGVETLTIGGRGRTAVRFLAVTGLVHTWFILAYFVPYNFFALKADTFPAMPSFLRAGICGEGTDYACPSDSVPIPHDNSLHIRPDDPNLPPDVRARQGLSGR